MSSDQPRDGGKLRRAVRRLATDNSEIEAHDLQRQAASVGCLPLAKCPEREVVTIFGTVRALTLRPRAGTPSLEVELYDGSGSVTLVWLGRREIAGLSPGRQLRATGRISPNGSRRLMFNPRYELVLKIAK